MLPAHIILNNISFGRRKNSRRKICDWCEMKINLCHGKQLQISHQIRHSKLSNHVSTCACVRIYVQVHICIHVYMYMYICISIPQRRKENKEDTRRRKENMFILNRYFTHYHRKPIY